MSDWMNQQERRLTVFMMSQHARLWSNIEIDWGNLKIDDVYPERIPDLFVGRPIMITGRLKNNASGIIRIKGKGLGKKNPILIFQLIPITVIQNIREYKAYGQGGNSLNYRTEKLTIPVTVLRMKLYQPR